MHKMFSPEEMGEDQLTIMPNGHGFINVSGVSPRLSTFAGSKMIPLLSTLRQDKNGKEIFEGDVLRIAGGELVEVEWNMVTAGFYADIKHNEWGWDEAMTDHTDKIEVVGNKYEHPNLLTEGEL